MSLEPYILSEAPCGGLLKPIDQKLTKVLLRFIQTKLLVEQPIEVFRQTKIKHTISIELLMQAKKYFGVLSAITVIMAVIWA
jgi:CTP:phosphocholine cytidylyltransferase-like protein